MIKNNNKLIDLAFAVSLTVLGGLLPKVARENTKKQAEFFKHPFFAQFQKNKPGDLAEQKNLIQKNEFPINTIP